MSVYRRPHLPQPSARATLPVPRPRRHPADTLASLVLAVAVAGIVFSSLYAIT